MYVDAICIHVCIALSDGCVFKELRYDSRKLCATTEYTWPYKSLLPSQTVGSSAHERNWVNILCASCISCEESMDWYCGFLISVSVIISSCSAVMPAFFGSFSSWLLICERMSPRYAFWYNDSEYCIRSMKPSIVPFKLSLLPSALKNLNA